MSTLSTTNLKNASSGSNNIVLNTDGTTTITAPSNIIKSGTAVASTSGTAIDFTGLPSWVKRVTVMFDGVSTNGTSIIQIQLGDAGGVEITGYTAGSSSFGASSFASTSFTTGFGIRTSNTAADTYQGSVTFTNISGNAWVAEGLMFSASNYFTASMGGTKTLSATLDRVRITTVNGTDTFDAGTINLLWEG
jgi:hypothetical protein